MLASTTAFDANLAAVTALSAKLFVPKLDISLSTTNVPVLDGSVIVAEPLVSVPSLLIRIVSEPLLIAENCRTACG